METAVDLIELIKTTVGGVKDFLYSLILLIFNFYDKRYLLYNLNCDHCKKVIFLCVRSDRFVYVVKRID